MKSAGSTLLTLFLLCFSICSLAVNPLHSVKTVCSGPGIRLKVTPWEGGVPLPGVSIRLSKDSVVIRDFRTFKPDGWNEESASVYFTLETNSKYTLTLNKKGYIPLVIVVDTHLPSGTALAGDLETPADIMMLKETDHPDLKDADFPLVLLKYDSAKGLFLPSKEYANSIHIMLQMK